MTRIFAAHTLPPISRMRFAAQPENLRRTPPQNPQTPPSSSGAEEGAPSQGLQPPTPASNTPTSPQQPSQAAPTTEDHVPFANLTPQQCRILLGMVRDIQTNIRANELRNLVNDVEADLKAHPPKNVRYHNGEWTFTGGKNNRSYTLESTKQRRLGIFTQWKQTLYIGDNTAIRKIGVLSLLGTRQISNFDNARSGYFVVIDSKLPLLESSSAEASPDVFDFFTRLERSLKRALKRA